MTNFSTRSRRRSAFGTHGLLLILGGSNLFAQVVPAAPIVAPAPKIAGPVVPGKFTDVTAARGVRFIGVASHTSHKYLLETMGSGVAVFDYDNDGLLDLFFVNGAPLDDPTAKDAIPEKRSPQDWNRLYRQRKDGTFEDVTEKSGLKGIGYGMGVAVGDFDNDGYEDLYVTGYGGNHLYHNNGNGTFTDVTEHSGTGGDKTPGNGWSTSAAWVDPKQRWFARPGRSALRSLELHPTSGAANIAKWYRAYCHPISFRQIASAWSIATTATARLPK